MSDMQRPNAVVVGASGFIGAALVKRLRRDSAHVIAVSRRGGPDITTVESYDDQHAMAAVIGDRTGVVYHLAALAHRTGIDEKTFVEANCRTAVTVAKAAIATGAARFLFVSSIGVLGNETFDRSFDEQTPARPQTPYTRSKWLAEQALTELFVGQATRLTIVRPPLVHGPGAPGSFGQLARAARLPLPLPLALVRNRRSLVGIDNLVDFLATAAKHPDAAGRTLLVSDGEDTSTPDLVRRLARSTPLGARLVPFPVSLLRATATVIGKRRPIEQLLGSLTINTSHSCEVLQWTPPYSLDQGLSRAMIVKC